jgi:hypothetical protein
MGSSAILLTIKIASATNCLQCGGLMLGPDCSWMKHDSEVRQKRLNLTVNGLAAGYNADASRFCA